jgi:xyloglucan:xyloglucosyl transferase
MAARFLSVVVVLLLIASSSAADDLLVPRPDTPALTFGEGYTQLFGDSNLRLHGDGKRVHISLDERTGTSTTNHKLFPKFS